MEEEKVEVSEDVSEESPKAEERPHGVARVPNREKGAMHSPPYVMMVAYILMAILSVVLAKLG